MTHLKTIIKNKLSKIIIAETGLLILLAFIYLIFYHIVNNNSLIQHFPSGDFYKKTLFILIILFIIYDIFYYFDRWTKDNRLVIFGIILITLFSSLPLFMNGISHQQDLNYHLVRIQTMADCLKSGQFPVRLNSGYFEGYGYPDAIFYGNFLLYIPVFFEYVGFTICQAYKVYVFIINLLTAVIAYICTYSISKNKAIGLSCSFAYVAVPFRSTLIYSNEFVGFYSGLTFFPLIVLAIYNIYTNNLENNKSKNKASILLAISMSCLIGTHILSTLLATVGILTVSIMLYKKTFTKDVIITYTIAVLETIGLSCYFIVPFLDYYLNVPIASKSNLANQIPHIQWTGINLLQLFGYNIDSHIAISLDISGNEIKTYNYSIGLVFILLLILCISLIITHRASNTTKVLLSSALVTMWISTCYFPWNYLSDNIPIFRWFSAVQFAWRYLAIVNVILFLLLCYVIQDIAKLVSEKYPITKTATISILCIGISLLCVSQCCNYASDYSNDAFIFYFPNKGSLDTYQTIGGEYLLDGTNDNKEMFTHELGHSDSIETNFISQNGCHYQFDCSNNTSDNGWVDVPMFNYKGYRAVGSDNQNLLIENGINNVVRIVIPAGYSGQIDVNYNVPFYWRMSEIITLISLLIIMVSFTHIQKVQKNNA